MSRYIDADLLDDIALQRGITRWEYKMIESVLFDFPTADVVPSRYGCGSAPYCSDVWEVDEDE